MRVVVFFLLILCVAMAFETEKKKPLPEDEQDNEVIKLNAY